LQQGFPSVLEPGMRSAIPLPNWEQQVRIIVEIVTSLEQSYRQAGRGPAIRQQTVSRKCLFLIQVGKYLPNHYRVFNTGDDSDVTTALTTGFYVYIEDALQSPCPSHFDLFFGGALVGFIGWVGFIVSSPTSRCHLCLLLTIRREYTMEASQVSPRFRNE